MKVPLTNKSIFGGKGLVDTSDYQLDKIWMHQAGKPLWRNLQTGLIEVKRLSLNVGGRSPVQNEKDKVSLAPTFVSLRFLTRNTM